MQRKPNTPRSHQRTTSGPALELPPDRAFVLHLDPADHAWSAVQPPFAQRPCRHGGVMNQRHLCRMFGVVAVYLGAAPPASALTLRLRRPVGHPFLDVGSRWVLHRRLRRGRGVRLGCSLACSEWARHRLPLRPLEHQHSRDHADTPGHVADRMTQSRRRRRVVRGHEAAVRRIDWKGR